MVKFVRLFALLNVLFFSPLYSAMANTESVQTIIESASQNILGKIEAGRAGFAGNESHLYHQVGGVLDELVNFESIARGVMGSYFKTASSVQRDTFAKKFRVSIVELYTQTLIAFRSKSIEVLPLKSPPTDKASLTMVVTGDDGSVFTLNYSMAISGGEWQVRNIIVNGINLGLTYRAQFKSLMEEKKDIDAVISAWGAEIQPE